MPSLEGQVNTRTRSRRVFGWKTSAKWLRGKPCGAGEGGGKAICRNDCARFTAGTVSAIHLGDTPSQAYFFFAAFFLAFFFAFAMLALQLSG